MLTRLCIRSQQAWASTWKPCAPSCSRRLATRNESVASTHRSFTIFLAAGLGFHLEALRTKLQQEPYGLLLHHAAAQLGTAVLPSQREMLQVGAASKACYSVLVLY